MSHHAFVPTHPGPTSQRYTTKLQNPRFSSHTSLFWTLPGQLFMLHHGFVRTHPEQTSLKCTTMSQTTHDSVLKTHLHPPPKIHLPKFQCSPFFLAAKTSTFWASWEPCKKTPSNKNLVATLTAKLVLSKLRRLKLPAPNLLQTCSQEVFPRLKSFRCLVCLKKRL